MKRAIAVFLILVVVFPVLAIPVFAVDTGYHFDKYEVTPFTSFTPFDGSQVFICDSFLPEGSYVFELVFKPELVAYGLTYNLYVSTVYFDYYFFDGDINLDSCLRSDFVTGGDAKLGDRTLSGNIVSSLYFFEDVTFLVSESPIMEYVESIIVTPCFTVDSQLDFFVGDICRGMFAFSGSSIVTVILVALGIIIAPVLLWFGYRYVKRKVVASFRKGKV